MYIEGISWKKDEKGRIAIKGRKASLLSMKQYKAPVLQFSKQESPESLSICYSCLLMPPGSGWSAWPERPESIRICAWKAPRSESTTKLQMNCTEHIELSWTLWETAMWSAPTCHALNALQVDEPRPSVMGSRSGMAEENLTSTYNTSRSYLCHSFSFVFVKNLGFLFCDRTGGKGWRICPVFVGNAGQT